MQRIHNVDHLFCCIYVLLLEKLLVGIKCNIFYTYLLLFMQHNLSHPLVFVFGSLEFLWGKLLPTFSLSICNPLGSFGMSSKANVIGISCCKVQSAGA